MFKLWGEKRIKTWNPFVGCRFDCSYCWARRIAKRLRCELCKSFEPHFHPERLDKIPRSGIIFVSDMGDISWCEDHELENLLEVVAEVQAKNDAIFFFETKNPFIYHLFPALEKDKTILSTTIETNRDELCKRVSLAPPPSCRKANMTLLKPWWPRRHISIEPIMDFDPPILFRWITDIEPEIVSIGHDNYHNHLPEPPLPKVLKLIEDLEASGIKVERKTLRVIT